MAFAAPTLASQNRSHHVHAELILDAYITFALAFYQAQNVIYGAVIRNHQSVIPARVIRY